MASGGKPTKTPSLPPPRRAPRLPAGGRLMAEGLGKVAPPQKLRVELIANPNGKRYLSRTNRVPVPLKPGVLKEYNRYGPLANYRDQEIVAADGELDEEEGAHVDALEEAAAGGGFGDVDEEDGAHVDALEEAAAGGGFGDVDEEDGASNSSE